MKRYSLMLAMALPLLLHGSEELVRNGSLQSAEGIPAGWERSVQLDGAVATVEGTEDGVKIAFLKTERALQARIIQFLDVPSNQAYRLSYEYRSAVDPRLQADVMLTGTGPMYRITRQSPRAEWTRREVEFFRPAHERGPLGLYVQNRSCVPIWYRNVSLKKLPKSSEQIERETGKMFVQSVSPDDQLLLPDTLKEHLDFVVRPDGIDRTHDIEALLFGAGGQLVQRMVGMNSGRIQLDATQVEDGVNYLIVNFLRKSDGVLDGFFKLPIERIPATSMKGDLDWNRHGAVRTREGKPFFPIAMFGLQTNTLSSLKLLKENGFNAVHSYDFETSPQLTEQKLKFLETLQKQGFKVILGLPRKYAERPDGQSALRDWVRRVRGYESVLCYYADEMYCVRKTPEVCFKMIRQVLCQEDPMRQFLPYDMPHAQLGTYWDGIMFGGDRNMIRLTKIRLGQNKPFVHVFGQTHYKASRAPSERAMAYELIMPVIQGARGIFYWWLPGVLWHNGEVKLLRERLFAGTRVLSQCGPWIVSPASENAKAKQKLTVTGDIQTLLAPSPEGTYVLLGVMKNGQGGDIRWEHGVQATWLYGSRSDKLNGGDVAVYLVP